MFYSNYLFRHILGKHFRELNSPRNDRSRICLSANRPFAVAICYSIADSRKFFNTVNEIQSLVLLNAFRMTPSVIAAVSGERRGDV